MTQTNKQAHTPGPWHSDGMVVVEENGGTVGETAGRQTELTHYEDDAERLANARLIAAAPDLLAACEQLVKAFDGDYFDRYAVYPLKVAIARAKGH